MMINESDMLELIFTVHYGYAIHFTSLLKKAMKFLQIHNLKTLVFEVTYDTLDNEKSI